MHEGTRRLLYLGGLIAAWSVPGLAILAILVGRLRPAYRDGWRMQLTAAMGMHAQFPTLEHPLPRTVRFPRVTCRDHLRDDVQADFESLVVTVSSACNWNARAETVHLDVRTLRDWCDRLAVAWTQSHPDTPPSWRISADRVIIRGQGEVLWRGTSFQSRTAIENGSTVLRATCRAAEDAPDLPPVSLQLAVRRGNAGGMERLAMIDTGGRRLPLELCRAALGRMPRVKLEAQADFAGSMIVRTWAGEPADAPFAPDPISEETVISGELRCVRQRNADTADGKPSDEEPGMVRIRLVRLRLRNGRAVDGTAGVVEANGVASEAVAGLFHRLLGGHAISDAPAAPAPLAPLPSGR